MNIDIRMADVRERIISSLDPVLSKQGFKIKSRQGNNIFMSKDNEGYASLQFFYYDYYPLHYEVNFVFNTYQNSIANIIKKFYKSNNREYFDSPNIGFYEGDFIEELSSKLLKYRSGYKNRISNKEDIVFLIDKYLSLVQYKLIPIKNELNSIEKTNFLLKNRKSLIVKNCAIRMMETSLITSKLTNDPEFENLFKFYQEELNILVKDYGVIASEASKGLKDLYKYLEN